MLRSSLALLTVTACASAGPTAGEPDASPTVDAFRFPDATFIDAAVTDCPSTDTCPAAMALGQVSGDTGNMKLSAMGHRAAWFRVRVTEDLDGVGGLSLRAAAKLTSPANADYDVFIFLNENSDVTECALAAGNTTKVGDVDDNRAEWGEGSIANGSDDSRNMSIEVRPISGNCDPAQPWQLEIEGNWL